MYRISVRVSFLHDKVVMETINVKAIKILVIRFIKKEISWLKNKNAFSSKVHKPGEILIYPGKFQGNENTFKPNGWTSLKFCFHN